MAMATLKEDVTVTIGRKVFFLSKKPKTRTIHGQLENFLALIRAYRSPLDSQSSAPLRGFAAWPWFPFAALKGAITYASPVC
jgi:hypothetical protein